MRDSKADYNNNQLVDGKRLKVAIEKGLKVIGPSGLEALFLDLERRGFVLTDAKKYSLEEIHDGIAIIFGDEVADLMMRKIDAQL